MTDPVETKAVSVDNLVERLTETQVKIIQLLLREPGLSREPISEKTGIPRTTTYDALSALINMELADRYVNKDGRRGRQPVEYNVSELGEIVLNEWYVKQELQSF